MGRLPLEASLFFISFYLYLRLVVDPRLLYHALGVFTPYFHFTFSADWQFFVERLVRPGGLAEYGTAFLSQLYRFGWAGALVTTILAWVMCFCVDELSGRENPTRRTVATYFPAIILLVMLGKYAHPLGAMLSLVISLLCFVLYLRLAPDGTVGRLIVLLLLCFAACHAAGARGLLFPALAAIDELLIRRRALLAATALVGGAVAAWWMGNSLSPGGSCLTSLLTDPGIRPQQWPCLLGLFVLFPAILAAAPLYRATVRFGASAATVEVAKGNEESRTRTPAVKASRNRVSKAKASKKTRTPRAKASRYGVLRLLRPLYSQWTRTAVALAIAGASAWLSFDASDRAVLQIDYYSQNAMWDQVLDAADSMPRGRYNLRSNRNILMALHHTRRIGADMFRYPQIAGMQVFASPEGDRDCGTWFQESRLFLDLGLVNQAERCACEALTLTGAGPPVLEHLATISAVKEQPATARVFLNALAKNPFDRGKAERMLRHLEEDVHGDPRWRRLRSMIPEKDTVRATFEVEDRLLALLERNPGNKAAFEFLMAYYLAMGQSDRVADNLWRLTGLGYATMPRHYQEAVVALGPASAARRATAYRIEPEVERNADRLAEIVRRLPDRESAIREAVAARLGGTYSFYLTFGFSGL